MAFGNTTKRLSNIFKRTRVWRGEISPEVTAGDVFFGAAAMYSGVYGGAANIGYNLGKEYGPMTMYLRYQRNKWKYKSVIFD